MAVKLNFSSGQLRHPDLSYLTTMATHRYRFMYMYHWTMLYQSLSLAGHDIGGRAPSAILLLGSISLIKQ
jgi:hypothetical protein